MKAEEVSRVRELFESVYQETVSPSVPDFEEATAGEAVYVALLNDRVVGMATVWESDCFIHFLFVDPAARHKKVGSTLINALAQEYSRPLTLKCLVKNTGGLAFYSAIGFEEQGTGTSEDGAYLLLCYPKK